MHWISSILGPVVWFSAKWELFIKFQWNAVFFFWRFCWGQSFRWKISGMGAGEDACALKHLFRHNTVEEESPLSVLPPTAWNCSTIFSECQAYKNNNTLEFANLIMFCKIQLWDEESSVSLSQWGTVLNTQEKSQGKKVFTPALSVLNVPYGSVGAHGEMCWLSWPISALLGTLMELWGCLLRVWYAEHQDLLKHKSD